MSASGTITLTVYQWDRRALAWVPFKTRQSKCKRTAKRIVCDGKQFDAADGKPVKKGSGSDLYRYTVDPATFAEDGPCASPIVSTPADSAPLNPTSVQRGT